jgi:hypothetical protein
MLQWANHWVRMAQERERSGRRAEGGCSPSRSATTSADGRADRPCLIDYLMTLVTADCDERQ